MPFRKVKSLATSIPSIQKKLAFSSVALFLLFTATITYKMFFSNLVME
jgi:hypothetical protein